MPHQTLKLLPGVDTNRTPVFNEAGISASQLIRNIPDRQGVALVQKLGGWLRYYPSPMTAIPRALWAWEDTNANSYLAVGCQTSTEDPGDGAPLVIIKDGIATSVTPRYVQDDPAVDIDVTVGSNIATITDPGSNVTNFDTVVIPGHISIGGIIIFGVFPCVAASPNTYQIALVDALGDPLYPTTSVVAGGQMPVLDTSSGSAVVTVTLPDHGFLVDDTYPILIETSVGGLTLFGNYTVINVISDDIFQFQSPVSATSTQNFAMNSGNARYIYYLGYGARPSGTGYGVGGYGTGGYGTGTTTVNPSVGTPIEATDWTFDNFGETLIACPDGIGSSPLDAEPTGGPIFVWSPQLNLPVAAAIPQAPQANHGMFVAMPQRQIVAWGSTFTGVQDQLLLRWCDINNYNNWTPGPASQANYFRIPTGSRIVAGLQAPYQGLIFTDVGVWTMIYVNLPDIYRFNELAKGCGLIAKKAVGVINNIVYWMGQSQFYQLTNEGAIPLPCPVWDAVFQNLDTSAEAVRKIRFFANSNFGEIGWYYPSLSGGTGEIDSYVKYNVYTGFWDIGQLQRTAWINQSVLGYPIGADATGLIYQHEMSPDADGQPLVSSFQTGYFAIAEGDLMAFIDQVWPDMKWGFYGGTENAEVKVTFYVKDYPTDEPRVYGPYTMSTLKRYLTPRFRGRLVSYKFESNDVGTFWRLGAFRYRVAPDGKF